MGALAGNAAQKDERNIKDPVHDFIEISSRVCRLIDTEQFQRLRGIKQLGTSAWVWPSASHDRFEHSLGVAHLARLLARHLQSTDPSLGITDRDVECVQIAGLCHDLGHGPFSHVWDNHFIPCASERGLVEVESPWKHEQASEMMFDCLIRDNEIDFPSEDVEFIKALIAGEGERCPDEKRFLFDIVANKRNGIDVDKFDYIARDNYHLGVKDNFSFSRLIHSAKVINDQICYNIKDATMVHELCHRRYTLHKTIYSHKTARAIEYMIVDALLAAEPALGFAGYIFKPEKYLYLTDSIVDQIKASEAPELERSRSIFKRISKRKLYRLVDRQVVEWRYLRLCHAHITSANIVREVKNLFSASDGSGEESEAANAEAALAATLVEDNIIVDICELHYGMKEKNPLDSVMFYSKKNPNVAHNARRGTALTLLPEVFGEIEVRIYTRLLEPHAIQVIQAGYRALCKTIPGYNPDDSGAEEEDNLPPSDGVLPDEATEGASTPQLGSLGIFPIPPADPTTPRTAPAWGSLPLHSTPTNSPQSQ